MMKLNALTHEGKMIQVNKLKALFVENGLSYKDVANEIGISEATMNRRMKTNNFGSDEIQKIVNLLKLSKDVAIDIFFPEFSTKSEAL